MEGMGVMEGMEEVMEDMVDIEVVMGMEAMEGDMDFSYLIF